MLANHTQPLLPFQNIDKVFAETKDTPISNNQNSLETQDLPVHNWYRFVLSYPPHLVRDYIKDFGLNDCSTVLDPFSGTGTTVIEAKLRGIYGIGVEANPFPHFASTVKINWTVDAAQLLDEVEKIAETAYQRMLSQGIDDKYLTCDAGIKLRALPDEANRALIKNSISPLPLHKTLVLLDAINDYQNSPSHKYCLLGLGNALVTKIGNLRFGPEVGTGKIKQDVSVVNQWIQEIHKMVADLRIVQGNYYPEAHVHLADSRDLAGILEPGSIDAVITSPPYPNEKDYTRTTRLESVVLGFFEDMLNLRGYKKTLLRSNTRGVYKVDTDDEWVSKYDKIQQIANEIESRRIELGKTSGFEKLYPKVTKLYFGGMARHLEQLKFALRPGAQLAYVVGDQASYLRVMIRTGELLAEIADDLGYEVERIDLFRTRFATATQCDLREEVVILKWNGK